MKKLLILLSTAALPFLLVWAAFILTGFSFNPIDMFQSGTFWGISVMYWFLYTFLIGLIVDVIDESINNNKKTVICPKCEKRITTS